MNWTGKILGMILGFIVGGPVGLLAGLFIGHFFDQPGLRRQFQSSFKSSQTHSIQTAFFNTTFQVMGYIAKSDGRVSENEILQARHIMQQMSLDEKMKREAIRLFTQGKQPGFPIQAAIAKLKQACTFQPTLLRVFLEMQIQMAYADGRSISDRRRQLLQNICQQLGFVGFQYSQFEQRYRAEQNYQRYRQSPRQDPRSHLDEAYKVLGVGTTASDSEVKKAYRRLMSQHHPDKLMAKGLPPEMIKMATQKTQQIKNAYEQIKGARK